MVDSPIALANDKVGIDAVCRSLGMYLPDYAVLSSYKTYCPFGAMYHADGGDSKAFRLYPESNTAFCFAGCGHFTPVRLTAFALDLSDSEAAQKLLDEVGYVEETIETKWAKLLEEDRTVDTDLLAEALKTYCSRIDPYWEANQFEEPVSSILNRCFALLEGVNTQEDASKWLKATKVVMSNTLNRRNNEAGKAVTAG